MHQNEVATDADLVWRLVQAQFPAWQGLPVSPLVSSGTDHALYRIGDALLARLPRIDWARGQPASDRQWLPLLAPHLPLTIPVPVATGRPGCGYPVVVVGGGVDPGGEPAAGRREPRSGRRGPGGIRPCPSRGGAERRSADQLTWRAAGRPAGRHPRRDRRTRIPRRRGAGDGRVAGGDVCTTSGEHPDLGCDTQQFTQRPPMPGLVQDVRPGEQQVGAHGEVEDAGPERQRRELGGM